MILTMAKLTGNAIRIYDIGHLLNKPLSYFVTHCKRFTFIIRLCAAAKLTRITYYIETYQWRPVIISSDLGINFKIMTTKSEESELDTELQELYLVSKQWITDLEFLDSELDFLKKLAGHQQPDAVRAEEFAQLTGLAETYALLKCNIADYLHRLEPLITHSSGNFGLDLVEEYSQLQHRLKEVLRTCQEIRSTVFDRSRLSS
jgi:hypothetical protein